MFGRSKKVLSEEEIRIIEKIDFRILKLEEEWNSFWKDFKRGYLRKNPNEPMEFGESQWEEDYKTAMQILNQGLDRVIHSNKQYIRKTIQLAKEIKKLIEKHKGQKLIQKLTKLINDFEKEFAIEVQETRAWLRTPIRMRIYNNFVGGTDILDTTLLKFLVAERKMHTEMEKTPAASAVAEQITENKNVSEEENLILKRGRALQNKILSHLEYYKGLLQKLS